MFVTQALWSRGTPTAIAKITTKDPVEIYEISSQSSEETSDEESAPSEPSSPRPKSNDQNERDSSTSLVTSAKPQQLNVQNIEITSAANVDLLSLLDPGDFRSIVAPAPREYSIDHRSSAAPSAQKIGSDAGFIEPGQSSIDSEQQDSELRPIRQSAPGYVPIVVAEDVEQQVAPTHSLQSDSPRPTRYVSAAPTRIKKRDVEIPKDQEELLSHNDSWLPAEPGRRNPTANVPISILRSWNEKADMRAHKDLQSPTDIEKGSKVALSQSPNNFQVIQAESESDAPIIEWSPSPDRNQPPSDSSVGGGEISSQSNATTRRSSAASNLPQSAQSRAQSPLKTRNTLDVVKPALAVRSPSVSSAPDIGENSRYRCKLLECRQSHTSSRRLNDHMDRFHSQDGKLEALNCGFKKCNEAALAIEGSHAYCERHYGQSILGSRPMHFRKTSEEPGLFPTSVAQFTERFDASRESPGVMDKEGSTGGDREIKPPEDGKGSKNSGASPAEISKARRVRPEKSQRPGSPSKAVPPASAHELHVDSDPLHPPTIPPLISPRHPTTNENGFPVTSSSIPLVTNPLTPTSVQSSETEVDAVQLKDVIEKNDIPLASPTTSDSDIEVSVPVPLDDTAVTRTKSGSTRAMSHTSPPPRAPFTQVKRTPYINGHTNSSHHVRSERQQSPSESSHILESHYVADIDHVPQSAPSIVKIRSPRMIQKGPCHEHEDIHVSSTAEAPSIEISADLPPIDLHSIKSQDESVVATATGKGRESGEVVTKSGLFPSHQDDSTNQTVTERSTKRIDSQYVSIHDSKRKASGVSLLSPNVTKRRRKFKVPMAFDFAHRNQDRPDPVEGARRYRQEFLASRTSSEASTPTVSPKAASMAAANHISSKQITTAVSGAQSISNYKKKHEVKFDDETVSEVYYKTRTPHAELYESNQNVPDDEIYAADDSSSQTGSGEVNKRTLQAAVIGDSTARKYRRSTEGEPDHVMTGTEAEMGKELKESTQQYIRTEVSNSTVIDDPHGGAREAQRTDQQTKGFQSDNPLAHPMSTMGHVVAIVSEGSTDGSHATRMPLPRQRSASDEPQTVPGVLERQPHSSDATSEDSQQGRKEDVISQRTPPHASKHEGQTTSIKHNKFIPSLSHPLMSPSSPYKDSDMNRKDEYRPPRGGMNRAIPFTEILPEVPGLSVNRSSLPSCGASSKGVRQRDSSKENSGTRATDAPPPKPQGSLPKFVVESSRSASLGQGLNLASNYHNRTALEGDAPSPQAAVHTSVSAMARVIEAHSLGSHNVFSIFKSTYPGYPGDLKHFTAVCKKISNLIQQNRMEHPALWDDFIIRHKNDYPRYLQLCCENAEDALTYEEFYRSEIEQPLHHSRVVTPKNLDQALSPMEEMNHVILDAHDPPLKNTELIKANEKISPTKSVASKRSVPLSNDNTPSSRVTIDLTLDEEETPLNLSWSCEPSEESSTPKRRRTGLSGQSVRRSLPWMAADRGNVAHRPTNQGSGVNLQVSMTDVLEPLANQPDSFKNNHSAVQKSLETGYQTLPNTSFPSENIPRYKRKLHHKRKYQEQIESAWGTCLGDLTKRFGYSQELDTTHLELLAKIAVKIDLSFATDLFRRRRSRRTGDIHSIAGSDLATDSKEVLGYLDGRLASESELSTGRTSPVKADATSHKVRGSEDLESHHDHEANAPSDWWRDENTPFRSFTRAYKSIRQGSGNSFATLELRDKARGEGHNRMSGVRSIDPLSWTL